MTYKISAVGQKHNFYKMSNNLELVKEFAFGATFGLCAGYASKKLGTKFVAGMITGKVNVLPWLQYSNITGAATASFLVLRAAIFDGHHLATWSPLEKDDPSFGKHLMRKARRETVDNSKRCDIFLRENLIVVGGFAGGLLVTSAS